MHSLFTYSTVQQTMECEFDVERHLYASVVFIILFWLRNNNNILRTHILNLLLFINDRFSTALGLTKLLNSMAYTHGIYALWRFVLFEKETKINTHSTQALTHEHWTCPSIAIGESMKSQCHFGLCLRAVEILEKCYRYYERLEQRAIAHRAASLYFEQLSNCWRRHSTRDGGSSTRIIYPFTFTHYTQTHVGYQIYNRPIQEAGWEEWAKELKSTRNPITEGGYR